MNRVTYCINCGEKVYAPEVNDANARIRKLYRVIE